jgi:thymidylate kinase
MARIRQRPNADVVIFDRYLYDELANLNLQNRLLRMATRLLLKLVPHPDVSFLLDADPILARQRKPEYPLGFLRFNRTNYLTVARMAGMKVIPPGEAEEVGTLVRCKFLSKLVGVQDVPAPEVLTSR